MISLYFSLRFIAALCRFHVGGMVLLHGSVHDSTAVLCAVPGYSRLCMGYRGNIQINVMKYMLPLIVTLRLLLFIVQ